MNAPPASASPHRPAKSGGARRFKAEPPPPTAGTGSSDDGDSSAEPPVHFSLRLLPPSLLLDLHRALQPSVRAGDSHSPRCGGPPRRGPSPVRPQFGAHGSGLLPAVGFRPRTRRHRTGAGHGRAAPHRGAQGQPRQPHTRHHHRVRVRGSGSLEVGRLLPPATLTLILR